MSGVFKVSRVFLEFSGQSVVFFFDVVLAGNQ